MYKWGIAILILIAFGINHHISDKVAWQKRADANWARMLDPIERPKQVDKTINSCRIINYVIAQEKYYRRRGDL